MQYTDYSTGSLFSSYGTVDELYIFLRVKIMTMITVHPNNIYQHQGTALTINMLSPCSVTDFHKKGY